MRKLIYSLGVSLDGYAMDRDGGIDWTDPDEELHQYYNDQCRELAGSLYGRRLYENMAGYWTTADQEPDASATVVDFARVWRNLHKYVFSSTLESVGDNSELVRVNSDEEVAAAVRKIKADGDGVLDLGGPTFAAPVVRAGLVDEFQLAVRPVLLGGGTPFFPTGFDRINLRLLEVRQFASAVLYRYEPV
jgi:dihydrofolate reductase